MRAVVFFRNVNQGQRGHPSTAQLVDALTAAGFAEARGFQSNGTFVVEAAETDAALAATVVALSAATGRPEAAFVLPLEVVADVVEAFPGPADRVELSVFVGELPQAVPFRGRECTVLSAGDGWALTRNDVDGAGNATSSLERVLGASVTSRGLPTMRRLVAKHGPRV